MTLKEAISNYDMTLEDIALYAGIGRMTLYNVMTGRTMPSHATARKLAETLGVSLEFTEVRDNVKYTIQVTID